MKYLVVNNPASGLSANKQSAILMERLTHHDYEWVDLNRSTNLKSYFHKDGFDYDAVIASGGDGTINAVIQAMKESSINCKLYVFPTGTTNEFAMHRNLTTKTCLELIDGMRSTKVYDAGRVNGASWFSYSLSFGTITKLSYLTPQKYKNKIGYVGYWLYGFLSKLWMRMKHYDVNFVVDEEKVEGSFVFGSITNSFSLGNVLKFPPGDVDLSDGFFEVLLVRRPQSIFDITLILSDLISRNYTKSRYLFYKKASKIYVNSEDKISWNADGELLGRFKNIVVEVIEDSIEC